MTDWSSLQSISSRRVAVVGSAPCRDTNASCIVEVENALSVAFPSSG